MKLKSKDADGKEIEIEVTRGEIITEALILNASGTRPESVTAFRTIRELVEPTEAEQSGMMDREFMRMFMGMVLERKVEAIEI